ncbi:MAG TPA: hypothetical protein VGR89_00450 [Puia sp.]|nr:hypothetical protein [Puia sp.]
MIPILISIVAGLNFPLIAWIVERDRRHARDTMLQERRNVRDMNYRTQQLEKSDPSVVAEKALTMMIKEKVEEYVQKRARYM